MERSGWKTKLSKKIKPCYGNSRTHLYRRLCLSVRRLSVTLLKSLPKCYLNCSTAPAHPYATDAVVYCIRPCFLFQTYVRHFADALARQHCFQEFVGYRLESRKGISSFTRVCHWLYDGWTDRHSGSYILIQFDTVRLRHSHYCKTF